MVNYGNEISFSISELTAGAPSWLTRVVKGDTHLRIPYESWLAAKAFAERTGRELREIAAKALSEYIKREEKKAK